MVKCILTHSLAHPLLSDGFHREFTIFRTNLVRMLVPDLASSFAVKLLQLQVLRQGYPTALSVR